MVQNGLKPSQEGVGILFQLGLSLLPIIALSLHSLSSAGVLGVPFAKGAGAKVEQWYHFSWTDL